MRIELDINGTVRQLDVEPRTTLLDCLRDQMQLNGAHAGCEHGVCAPAPCCSTASRCARA